jgi:hypothetical protein
MGAASKLRYLRLRNHHETVLPSLLEGLKANTVLEELHLSTCSPIDVKSALSFRSLLHAFNFSLKIVRLYDESFVWPLRGQNELLGPSIRQNIRTCRVYDHLSSRNFRVGRLHEWNPVLASLSTKPALLYRFLRHGNLDTLDRHMSTVNAAAVSIREQELFVCEDQDQEEEVSSVISV